MADEQIQSDEYEQEPVPEHKLLGWKYFLGLYAGEHVAGTEFVIGAMFVSWGTKTQDVILGLILGNILAVLTWVFICAPIACGTRLTLYWYLRKIAGPGFNAIYNIVNAVLYCILGGSMITVSASAVRLLFGISAQTMWYPTSIAFVLVVLFVGIVVVLVTMYGFKQLSLFSSVCAPWLMIVFICGLMVAANGISIHGLKQPFKLDNFINLGNSFVWLGKKADGSAPTPFYVIMAFAWVCNLAMHGALSDMSILRYAKKPIIASSSALGMFFGHFLAWISAGMMGAFAAMLLNKSITQMDSGELTYNIFGFAGILAVIIAGWTTSNPTLYRSGLAFQALFPQASRRKITFIVGIITAIIACFPFVFTKLLDFVGYMGLLIVPVGGIIFVEHWLFPKFGLTRYWNYFKKSNLNAPALITWILAVIIAITLERFHIVNLFFLFLPIWIFSMICYTILASISGAKGDYQKEQQLMEESDRAVLAKQREEAKALNNLKTEIKKNPVVIWFDVASGICLLICLIMAYVVLSSTVDNFEIAFSNFKNFFIIPTLAYFVIGTIGEVLRQRQNK